MSYNFYALCQQVHIEFTEGEDRITLEGPTKDVQMVQSQIEVIVADLVSPPDTFTNAWPSQVYLL